MCLWTIPRMGTGTWHKPCTPGSMVFVHGVPLNRLWNPNWCLPWPVLLRNAGCQLKRSSKIGYKTDLVSGWFRKIKDLKNLIQVWEKRHQSREITTHQGWYLALHDFLANRLVDIGIYMRHAQWVSYCEQVIYSTRKFIKPWQSKHSIFAVCSLHQMPITKNIHVIASETTNSYITCTVSMTPLPICRLLGFERVGCGGALRPAWDCSTLTYWAGAKMGNSSWDWWWLF